MSVTDAVADSGPESDAALLDRFERNRDEAAFTELVRRYGPLVWGVCRRRLARREDAEDAFQAAFLLLAAKARTIRRPQVLPAWLHRTACRAAIRVATSLPVALSADQPDEGLDAFAEVARREAAAAIDEELVRLPTRYRDPIVLFHMEGFGRREVADRLGISEPAVKALLTRGRSLLRSRLARRGVALPLLLPLAIDPVPAHAADAATRLAVMFGRSGLSPFDLLGIPAKGLQPMATLFSGKTLAVGVVAVVCLALILTTGGPAGADAAGQKNREASPAIDTALDISPAADPRPLELAAVEPPVTAKADANKSSPSNGVKDTKSMSQRREQHMLDALAEDTRLEFLNTPLSDALAFLADVHEFHIIPDRRALEEEGIDIHQLTVDQVLSGITLRSGLNIILDEHDLTYVIEDEVMKITTPTAANDTTSLRAYEIGELTTDVDSDVLPETIRELLAVQNPAGETPTIKRVGDRLLIGASLADQMRVMEILRLMEAEADAE